MESMFSEASVFDSGISGWNVSSVQIMNYMFYTAPVFNNDLSSWDVSAVNSIMSMFERANVFNSDISSWDVSSVTLLWNMFDNAQEFGQKLCEWNFVGVDAQITEMFFNSRCTPAYCLECTSSPTTSSPTTSSPTTFFPTAVMLLETFLKDICSLTTEQEDQLCTHYVNSIIPDPKVETLCFVTRQEPNDSCVSNPPNSDDARVLGGVEYAVDVKTNIYLKSSSIDAIKATVEKISDIKEEEDITLGAKVYSARLKVTPLAITTSSPTTVLKSAKGYKTPKSSKSKPVKSTGSKSAKSVRGLMSIILVENTKAVSGYVIILTKFLKNV